MMEKIWKALNNKESYMQTGRWWTPFAIPESSSSVLVCFEAEKSEELESSFIASSLALTTRDNASETSGYLFYRHSWPETASASCIVICAYDFARLASGSFDFESRPRLLNDSVASFSVPEFRLPPEYSGYVYVWWPVDVCMDCLRCRMDINGKVPSDISRLSRLVSLDLSWERDLEMPNLGNFVQNLTMLRELDLSDINMSSPFPHVLANLSSLKSLKLAECQLYGEFPVNIFRLPNPEVLIIGPNYNLYGFIPELHWGCGFSGSLHASLGNLYELTYLDISRNKFLGSLPASLGNLYELAYLDISRNKFQGSLPASLGNLYELAHLDISENKFQGQIPACFANLIRLSTLHLSSTNFSGGIWHWLANLAKPTELDLADAQLSGPIPSSFRNLTRLAGLTLPYNNLQGEIPNSLWELKDLETLDLSGNNLSGTVDLHRLKNLEILSLNFNNISFVSKTEMNTMLPKLFILSLESCYLHEFPKILGHLSGLELIDLSHNKIGGSIPTWIGNGSRESLWGVDLSHNFLTGFVDNRINLLLPNLIYLDISSNLLKTELPTPPPSMSYYNISNNILFGDIQSICGAKSLVVLDLSNNSPNDTIPTCLENIHSLSILDLGKNELEGSIPQAYPKGCALNVIDSAENRLQGSVPRSLTKCKMLEYLNLGYNQILDGFPLWLSKLTELKVVILKSNNFHGPIETYRSRFNFSNLHIMDLSDNSFDGELPSEMLQSFHAMKVPVGQDRLEYMNTLENVTTPSDTLQYIVDYRMKLMNRGHEREYPKVPYALMGIDLSNNKFQGCILDAIGDLKSLLLLSLSNNILTGSIPLSLANPTRLESLDLSRNKLSGEIPQQLAQLTFLSSFNVSHNQLSGPIPQGSQFNTFTIDSFAMNEGLCGDPLPKKCTMVGDNLPFPPSRMESEESPFNLDWKFVLIGVGVGFLVGVVLGNPIIDEKSKWFVYYSKRMAKRWNRLGRH
ncbi:receptor like protein 26-like [Rhodamnia argentea]|uniref:Receptor like protein 26-like n=1 Tax=Rhodamnia argentea TaxID=178133 RepID=A0ABM3H4W8_9MYRT|nr:receptor like protein 26-like [Rhodamnia argentea]